MNDLLTAGTARLGGAVFVLASVCIAFAGCGGRETLPAAGGPVSLRVIDEKALADALARHRGQVVLVDFWATWCGPCVELFGHTVALHRRLADRGLAVISVSLDDPDSQPAVLQFLKDKGATFENFLSKFGAGSQSVEAFRIDDGALPLVRLYDREGLLRQTFGTAGEAPTAKNIDQAVDSLVGKS